MDGRAKQKGETVNGVCRVCGNYGPLTFEHVPPEAAFNHHPRWRPDTQELVAFETEGRPMSGEGIGEPRGAGAYTLCADCNNRRCNRYAIHFVDWAFAWDGALRFQTESNRISLTKRTRRSRVMKQIVAMFLSANPPGFGERHPELRRYVMNAPASGLPPYVGIHAGLTRSQDARQAGITGYTDLATGSARFYSEIAFAPFVLQLTLNSPPTDERMVDISFFAKSGYNDNQDTTLTLPVLNLRGFIPGMY